MISLSTFQEYLSSKAPLPQMQEPRQYVDGQEQQLLRWAALLPQYTGAQQADQLEKVLAELAVADLDDRLRLQLMNTVMTALDRLIVTLRKHYIYEVGSFSASQLSAIAQVKSLYYLSILVYDRIIRRESFSLDEDQQYEPLSGQWKRYFSFTKTPPITLAAAIYQSLLLYQKLLNEKAICYQKPPEYLWSALNQLYYLACQHHIAHIDLSSVVVTRHADDIHQLYCQSCLHSLLNVYAMQRSNVLLVQRLLPVWAGHVVATIEPQTDTRVFVDLRSDNPPTYLTAHSKINPYDEQHDCLFIELVPLVSYLKLRVQALADDGNEAVVCCLMTKVWRAITYRYIQPQLTMPTKYSPKRRATITTGFNNIHYQVAGAQSLMSLIAIKELSDEQRPRYDTLPKKHTSNKVLEVETFDSRDTLSHFRTLRLLPMGNATSSQVAADASIGNNYPTDYSPPSLRIMSLFLLSRSDTDVHSTTTPNSSLGIVRWLNLDSQNPEVEWQVLGHEFTACAIRLDNRGSRSQHFVPALLVGDDEQLQTACTLLLPAYHFKTNDRVIMRLGNRQKPLRLQRSLLSTEGFSQYEVVRL